MDKRAYISVPALKVEQPLGVFYVITISAETLRAISFSEPMAYKDAFGNVKGSQRPKDEKRLKDIAKYIDSVEMAFPNSIILAANYTPNGLISKDETERWKVSLNEECGTYTMTIPKSIKLAAVIDGQHQLNAFEFVTVPERFSELQLVCSVYLDLPNSYQAFLFATINTNQKKVDRSLALEQFGYNVGEEDEKSWTPEKLAVFLSRKLNTDKQNSPLYKHIKVAPLNPENLFAEGIQTSWVVSTATIVDGICSLISNNVKRDRVEMQQKSILKGRSRDMLTDIRDFSPLRSYFISSHDQTIYNTVLNFFKSVYSTFWQQIDAKSYINKTVGVQACFDILKMILNSENSQHPESIDFSSYLKKASSINFSDKFFQASGIGRSRIKNTIAIAANLISIEKMKQRDIPFFETILKGESTQIGQDKWVWEEEAENAIINVMEKAEWNFETNSINLFVEGDYETSVTYKDSILFFNKLVEVAENSYNSHLPLDNEFAEEQKEKFDSEELVKTVLINYEDKLGKIGWNW